MNNNGEPILYSDYVLSEAILPKQIEYGTDFRNKEWKQFGTFFVTFFNSNNNQYVYIFQNGFIGFGVLDKQPNQIKNIADILNNNTFKRTRTPDVIKVFNNFFFITLEVIKKFQPEKLHFDGSDKALGNLYEIMLNNKKLLDEIKNHGFVYIDKKELNHRYFYTFERI